MPGMRDYIDPGAPEFFVTESHIEPIPDSDCVRVFAFATRSEGERILQYTAIIPRHRLRAMVRRAEDACAGEMIAGGGADMVAH